MSLDALLQRADLWRGGNPARREAPGQAGVPSGSTALDAELPGGGWPRGALTELLLDRPGGGELRLLLPALARLSAEGSWLAWVAPPYLPYAPALAAAGIDPTRTLLIRPDGANEVLWAMEQSLRSGVCGAVLGWPSAPDHRALRRLQLAAERGTGMGILFRPLRAAGQASPAALRLRLEPVANGLRLHLLKRRGGWGARPVLLPTAD